MLSDVNVIAKAEEVSTAKLLNTLTIKVKPYIVARIINKLWYTSRKKYIHLFNESHRSLN